MRLLFTLAVLIFTSSCGSVKPEYKYPKNEGERTRDEIGSILTGSKERFTFSKGVVQRDDVNKNLWMAALDVMSFMPFESADIKNGLIVTEWYSPENITNERFKFNIMVVSNQLRANTLKIKGFREIKNNKNQWQQAKISDDLISDLEKKILNKARKLNISNQ